MSKTIIAGVDIGGSHITVALVDLKSMKIIESTWRRKEVNSQGSAAEIIAAWTEVINESFKSFNLHPTKIGIAMPGPFDYEKGVSYIKDQNKYDSLYGTNVKEQLSGRLGLRVEDIIMANDAACFLQGEVFGGAGKRYERVIGLTLGTGLGSAMSIEGEAEDASLWCSPYKGGIAEDYFSARWFVKRYKELSGEVVENVKELAGLVNKKGYCQMVFDEFGKNFGEFLLPILKEQLPELIILGGNISLAFPYFSKPFMAVFQNTGVDVIVKTAELGENAALTGAASNHYISSFSY